MQYPCIALGLLSKKQYAPKAEIRFMIKLLTDLWRECTICAVFFSMSLMVSTLHARWSLKPWHQPIVPFPSVAIPLNTRGKYISLPRKKYFPREEKNYTPCRFLSGYTGYTVTRLHGGMLHLCIFYQK